MLLPSANAAQHAATGRETTLQSLYCEVFTIFRWCKQSSEQVCLASSDLLHTHLALAYYLLLITIIMQLLKYNYHDLNRAMLMWLPCKSDPVLLACWDWPHEP